jgi:regulator of protease activity HflC (stomatin/prohibitin superfamily)
MRAFLKKITGLFTGIKTKLTGKIKKNIIPVVIVVLILLFILVSMFRSIVYIIKPGEAGVFWSLFTGTQVDYVYSEGIKTILPINRMYIYNIRIQEKARTLHVLTSRGLKLNVYYSVRYAPKYKLLGLLHQRVGPDYLNVVILPEIDSVLREVIGTMEAEQIWTTGRKVIVEAINNAIEQMEQLYININDVLIKRIELPESVAKSISFKIEQEHLVKAHEFIAEQKRVEGRGIRDHINIIAESIPKESVLQWKGMLVTQEIAKSNNTKVVIIGRAKDGLPIILNADK